MESPLSWRCIPIKNGDFQCHVSFQGCSVEWNSKVWSIFPGWPGTSAFPKRPKTVLQCFQPRKSIGWAQEVGLHGSPVSLVICKGTSIKIWILPWNLTCTLKISPWKRRFSASMLNFGGVDIFIRSWVEYGPDFYNIITDCWDESWKVQWVAVFKNINIRVYIYMYVIRKTFIQKISIDPSWPNPTPTSPKINIL